MGNEKKINFIYSTPMGWMQDTKCIIVLVKICTANNEMRSEKGQQWIP
jgi:hypothetical protein